jgi:hypothetical protein
MKGNGFIKIEQKVDVKQKLPSSSLQLLSYSKCGDFNDGVRHEHNGDFNESGKL